MVGKTPITMTDGAIERVKTMLAKRGKPSVGIRIGVRTKGCSGMSYSLEFADERSPLTKWCSSVTSPY